MVIDKQCVIVAKRWWKSGPKAGTAVVMNLRKALKTLVNIVVKVSQIIILSSIHTGVT